MSISPLAGKVALVTGGSRGIGAAIAKRLAADGAKVAITYSKSKDRADQVVAEIQKAGGTAIALLGNAEKPDTLPPLAKEVVKQLGSLDILVNNAGQFIGGEIGSTVTEQYKQQMAVNVDAVFTLTNAAVPLMKSGARIINIGSVVGERAIMPGINPYVASKFAVSGFTRAWAKDLGAKNILVNAILPGPIDTEMNPADNGDFATAQIAAVPLGRYGKPEEVAGAVAFLAGPDASYITGMLMRVDGGINA